MISYRSNSIYSIRYKIFLAKVIFTIITGVFSIGIPGEILGYFKAKEKFGSSNISMERLFEPTIKLCEEGIPVSRSLSKAINKSEELIRKDNGMR